MFVIRVQQLPLVVSLCASLAAGCSSSSSPVTPTDGGTGHHDSGITGKDAPSGHDSGSLTVGPSGGTLNASGGVSITVPPGAVASAITLTATASPNASIPSSITALGVPYVLGPEGTTFLKPVTVTMPFSPADLPSGATVASVAIFTAPVGSTSFTPLSATSHGTTTVSGTTMHFSVFVPGVSTASPDAGVDATVGPDAGVSCDYTCGSDATAGGPFDTTCNASCGGHTYSVSCGCASSSATADCTCTKDGTRTAVVMPSCTNLNADTVAVQGCGFPGQATSTPDAGTGPADAGCNYTSGSDATAGGPFDTTCSASCGGHTYAVLCGCTSSGATADCTCTKDGTQTAVVMPSCTDLNSCTVAVQGCGFPGQGAATPDAGSGTTDAGCNFECGSDATAGGPFDTTCNASCGGHAYSVYCGCASTGATADCTCTKDGTQTAVVMPSCTDLNADTVATQGCGFP
jgi:ZU5 domain